MRLDFDLNQVVECSRFDGSTVGFNSDTARDNGDTDQVTYLDDRWWSDLVDLYYLLGAHRTT